MSTYTIRLQRLLQSNYDIWDRERPFPIFDETHRSELEKMIEDHYYMREIGFETPMAFKHYLNTRMREIMPKYNAMFASQIDFNLTDFYTHKERGTFDSTHSNEGTDNHDTNSTVKNNIERRQYKYDTPMNFTTESIGGDHMSGATIDKANGDNNYSETQSNTDTTHNDTGTRQDNYDKTVVGQSPYKTIEEYRALVFNIDLQIINELEDLFMMVF